MDSPHPTLFPEHSKCKGEGLAELEPWGPHVTREHSLGWGCCPQDLMAGLEGEDVIAECGHETS